jgi:long-chain fatty acid transport protein
MRRLAHLFLLVALAFALALAAPPAPPAIASPVDLFGFGARGQGLAGAVGADAEGFESVYYNPAGLAFDRRPTFALGYQLGSFELTLDGAPRDALDAPALSIGFGVPIPFGGALANRLSIGLGFTIPQTSILIADIARPSDPSFILVENRAQTVSIQAALGVRITDWLALGIGTLALAELDGEIRVEPNASGRIGSKVKDELIADYALVAGLMLRLFPFDPTEPAGQTTATASDSAAAPPPDRHALHIALTYRGESRADFNLPITADLGADFGIPIPELVVNGTAQYDPAEIALELAARLRLNTLDFLTIHAGASLDLWSAFPLPLAYSATRESTIPQPQPDFSDVVSLKLGLEGDFTLSADDRLTIRPRLGFAYNPSPAPAQTGFHNHLDSDRMIFAAGFGFRWNQFRLDLAGQLHDLAERTHTKSADTPDTNPAFPSVTHSGHILFIAVEMGVSL